MHFPKMIPVLILALVSGCVSYTRATRAQEPFFIVPQNTKVALVTVEVPQWVMERAPSDFSNMRGMIKQSLVNAFSGTHYQIIDKLDLGYTMVIGPKAPQEHKVWMFTATERPSLPQDQLYLAEKPTGLPTGVTEPLVLGIYVVGWTIDKKQVGSREKARYELMANTDIVYSLWTRDGREIETRRVMLAASPMSNLRAAVTFIPDRNHWLSWQSSKEHWSKSAPSKREELFRFAVNHNTLAFAFPFGRREVHMTALWDDSNDQVKPGIEQAKEKQLDQAYHFWKALVAKNPKLAPAYYNMAVVREIQGDDSEARKLFEKALQLQPEKKLYQRALQTIKERCELRHNIDLNAG